MTRTHIAALLVLAAAIPAATAASFFASSKPNDVPCFIAGDTGYRMTKTGAADLTIRIDNAAAAPDLRLQLTDDVAAADFVLVDGDAGSACTGAAAVQNIRLDAQGGRADLTVALSRAPAPYKIYVQSAAYSAQDAAALFAAIWRHGRKTAGSGREFAARN